MLRDESTGRKEIMLEAEGAAKTYERECTIGTIVSLRKFFILPYIYTPSLNFHSAIVSHIYSIYSMSLFQHDSENV